MGIGSYVEQGAQDSQLLFCIVSESHQFSLRKNPLQDLQTTLYRYDSFDPCQLSVANLSDVVYLQSSTNLELKYLKP